MNTVIISLDCVRPEALSCYPESFAYRHRAPYGAETPNIESIASDGIVFTKAFCQAPFTPASHASLFTGQNPYKHGIRGMFSYELNDSVKTIAELFSAIGYDTGGFIGAHALSSCYGLDRGFDTYDEEFESAYKNWIVGNRRPCKEVTCEALKWLNGRDSKYLLFVHYFDAHDGGDAPVDRADGVNKETKDGSIRGLYNSYIRTLDESMGSPIKRTYRTCLKLNPNRTYGRRYHLKQVQSIDEQIGRIIKTLQDRGEYEETTIIILSDHGESFGAHGEYGHRKYLYDTTIRIPLIIKPENNLNLKQRVCDDIVRSIDVFPTLSEEADVQDVEVEGENLYEIITGDVVNRKAYAETRKEQSANNLYDLITDLTGLRTDRWKLIYNQLDGSYELYDIERDPGEQSNVADEYMEVRDELATELKNMLSDTPDKEECIVSDSEWESVRDHLEGLGYM